MSDDCGRLLPWQEAPLVVAAQRRTLRVLVASQIVGGIGIGAAASLGALLAESVTGSTALAGLARTSSTLGAALFGLPLAMLAMRSGRRAALSMGWALAAVGGVVIVVSAIQGSVVLLILGMVMFGSGSATNLQSRFAAADLAVPAHRARALSTVVWSTTIGAVVGPNLAEPGAAVSRVLGLPKLSGAFVIAAVVFGLATLVLWIALRPDPLQEARRHESRAAGDALRDEPARAGLLDVLRLIRSTPNARFAFIAIVSSHTIMGAVMTMTPVNMTMLGDSLTLVGITISVHILGMYAFSPVVGALADRFGYLNLILAGQACFVGSVLCSGLSGHSVAMVAVGLFLLGLGWSASLVAGSAMLSDSVKPHVRPAVQGTTDAAMNTVSALAAGLSGPILSVFGFGGLNLIAGLLVVPTLLLAPSAHRRNRAQPPAPHVLT